MEELALKLLNVRPCGFAPRHNRNLANEFLCYTNYDCTIVAEENKLYNSRHTKREGKVNI